MASKERSSKEKDEWYLNGKLHRGIENDDLPSNGCYPTGCGPAVNKRGGYLEWYRNGKLHRGNGEDGPAIVYPDGKEEWYQNGVLTKN